MNEPNPKTADIRLLDGLRPLPEFLPAPGAGSARDATIRIALATIFRELGDYEAAERLYLEILVEEPRHQGALRNRVWNALRRGEMEGALICVDEALEQIPGDPVLLRNRATVLGRLGRHEEAVAQLELLREESPNDIPTIMALAHALRAAGNHARADLEFAAVLALESDHVGALLGRIDSALSFEDPQEGLSRCDQALDLLPRETRLQERRAILLQRCGRPAEAVELLRQLVAEDPNRLQRRIWLGDALRAIGDNKAAMTAYDEVIAVQPANRDALLGRIDTALAIGDVDAALELCDRAISVSDDARFHQRKAAVLQRAGRDAESVGNLEVLHRQTPEDLPLTIELARARLASGDLDGADDLFARVLEADPGHRAALLGRVDIRERQGDTAGAMALLEESLDLPNGRADGPDAA
ncbi:MAG: tetratricopeptide repeat protein [Xanthomonadales bacterium]|jgi:tetratricopeptide (TPR) repeat protein|nr:tetratricopeptide repeat protein [Xanthomonadales bacterium]